jgi:hypothetical protein
MRKFCFLSVLISFLFCVFACKKDNSPQGLIVGKWNLQRLKIGYYINDEVQLDTTLNSPASFTNYVQFNKNGSYTTILHSGVSDTTNGSYSLSDTTLSLSKGQSSFFGQVISIPYPIILGGIIKSTTPMSVKVAQISSNSLTIHAEIQGPEFYSNGSFYTKKQIFDEFYTK